MVEVVASNDKCKKSNFMGSSKTWRFQEYLKLRSNSDGKDAFVLLNPSGSMPMRSNKAKKESVVSKKGNSEKCKIVLSAHEKLYVMNRKRKEISKQKSFLPYKRGLIGFFTNRNRFTKNLHPF
ncbi:hypothetical protein E2542_SST17964 [Spatholobus suberectus]|nr:hypothetical protein E2542_SST17964 [Spatholobus suberectus]